MLLSLNAGVPDKFDKLFFEGRRFIKVTGLFLALLGLALWCYQLTFMWLWQQDLQDKLKQEKTQQIITAPDQLETLTLSNITLPPLPTFNNFQDSRESAPISAKILNGKQLQAQLIKQRTAVELEEDNQPTVFSQPEPILVRTPTKPGAKDKSDINTQSVLQQLHSPLGLDLQIALPQNSTQRERLLNYLYRCGGAQFAVLQQQQLVYLSPKRYIAPSKWLRVVSGELSAQERTWLANHHGNPVRLFPNTMDQRLASYIATALQGKKLDSLRAQYMLTNAGLALSHIKLNKQPIPNNWLLHQSQCF